MSVLPRRFSARVTLLVCVTLAATVAVFAWVTSARQGEQLEATLRAEAATLAKTVAGTSVHHLVVQDYAALEELILEVAALPHVVGVQVVEPDGSGLVNVVHEPLRSPRKVGGPFRIAPPTGTAPALEDEEGRVVHWHPIVAGDMIGWVRMTSDLGEVGAARAAIWRNSLALGALLVAAGSALLLLLLRPTATGIRRLAGFARTLGERTGERVEVADGPAEIAELGAALNAASAELQAREHALLAERERFEVTLRSIGDAVVATDTGGAVVLMNGVAERLTGWSSAEALGRPLAEVCRLADERGGPPPAHPAAAALASGVAGATPEQTLLVPRDREARIVAANGAPILDAQGRLLGTVTVIRDVSERAALERQLRQAQKMEAVGQLAGGIAHDFNNILSAIIGYGTIVQMRMGAQDPLRDHVGQILQAADRAAGLTQSLLAFSRKQVMALRTEDLNAVVRGVEKMLRRLVPESIALRVELTPGELPVTADRGQLEQVLFNLVANARDAISGAGEIRIATGAAPGDGDGAGSASITVADTGAGMTRAVREKIFEPFFTTKEIGRGTGLGLAMVYGIVSQHRGRITVESEPGAGSTFRVHLPLARAADAVPEAPAQPPARGGSETILLVEDDAAVRSVTRMVLEAAGYSVVDAADGEEALRLFAQAPGSFDLLVSDVVMPRRGGADLLRGLRELRPGQAAVFMSGYTPDPATRELLRGEGVALLTKPVPPQDLLRAARAALDGRAGEGGGGSAVPSAASG